jgi:hypothetical protein
MRRPHSLVSVFILLVLGLHVIPVVTCSSEGKWPFMAYAMYRHSRGPGPIRAVDLRAIAITARGERLEITPGTAPQFF